MISFFISVVALILGYLIYGKFVERVFAPDPARATPAISKADGVDFIPMPTWKVSGNSNPEIPRLTSCLQNHL